MQIYVEGDLRKDKIEKIIHSYGFDRDVIGIIDDVAYVKVRKDKTQKGYFISIIQNSIEPKDIVEYFTERFNRKYSAKSPKNKFIFNGYTIGSCKSNDFKKHHKVSIANFYYRANMFERKLI